jgi:hypothetical protein
MVYGFLKQCHGHADINSEPEKGTVIKLYFPHRPEATVEVPVERPVEEARGDQEVILVVEDNSAIRKLAVQVIGIQNTQSRQC